MNDQSLQLQNSDNPRSVIQIRAGAQMCMNVLSVRREHESAGHHESCLHLPLIGGPACSRSKRDVEVVLTHFCSPSSTPLLVEPHPNSKRRELLLSNNPLHYFKLEAKHQLSRLKSFLSTFRGLYRKSGANA